MTNYKSKADWTATFGAPVSDLLLYTVFWRGLASEVAEPPVTYTFDQPFTILSGLGAATVNGNTLELPDTGFHSGIIKFTGPFSSLSVVDTNVQTLGSVQALTFGLLSPATPADLIDALGDDIQALVDSGALSGGQGKALTNKLDSALKKLDQGDTQAAIDKLQAVIDQVTNFINDGVLTSAEGQPLIDAANAIIDSLSS